MQSFLIIKPVKEFSGEVVLPGSKSISNRALLLAALANGTTKLTNLPASDDVNYMIKALQKLGVILRFEEAGALCVIVGNVDKFYFNNPLDLFVGNAGTVMRLLTAILSLGGANVRLTGNARMQIRPIGALVSALRQGGAKINYLYDDGYPPLQIKGGFCGGYMRLDGTISSQFLTALLMITPMAIEDSCIEIQGSLVSRSYIDLTLSVMHDFGINIHNDNYRFFYVTGRQRYVSPGEYLIEGDASSASYFLAGAAIKGGRVQVKGINRQSIQGDIRFAQVLQKMGAQINWGKDHICCVRSQLNGIDIDMNDIPDTAMTVAIVALFASGETVVRNIANWRIKETDRFAAMARGLRQVGAQVKEIGNDLHIKPPLVFLPAVIETYDDHRIAMCFSLVALSGVSIVILNPKCTAKTFPDYFRQFALVSHRNG